MAEELGSKLIHYYNSTYEYEPVTDPRYGLVIPNKQALPFDCPNCGTQLVCARLQLFSMKSKDSFVPMYCASETCYHEHRTTWGEFIATVPQVKDAIRKAEAVPETV